MCYKLSCRFIHICVHSSAFSAFNHPILYVNVTLYYKNNKIFKVKIEETGKRVRWGGAVE